MKQLSDQLNDYITNEIELLLPNFSRAYINRFTLGYNVSSLSESTNSLFKRNLQSCNYTLKELKIEITDTFKHKSIIQKYNDYKSRKKSCLLKDVYGVSVTNKIKTHLLDSLLKSFRLVHVDDNTYCDPIHPDEFYVVDYLVCECNKMKFAKLPCSI